MVYAGVGTHLTLHPPYTLLHLSAMKNALKTANCKRLLKVFPMCLTFGNTVFLPWKHFVSAVETLCFRF